MVRVIVILAVALLHAAFAPLAVPLAQDCSDRVCQAADGRTTACSCCCETATDGTEASRASLVCGCCGSDRSPRPDEPPGDGPGRVKLPSLLLTLEVGRIWSMPRPEVGPARSAAGATVTVIPHASVQQRHCVWVT